MTGERKGYFCFLFKVENSYISDTDFSQCLPAQNFAVLSILFLLSTQCSKMHDSLYLCRQEVLTGNPDNALYVKLTFEVGCRFFPYLLLILLQD